MRNCQWPVRTRRMDLLTQPRVLTYGLARIYDPECFNGLKSGSFANSNEFGYNEDCFGIYKPREPLYL